MHYVSINQCLLVFNSKILSITRFVALTRLVIDYRLSSNHCDYCAQFQLAVGKIEKKKKNRLLGTIISRSKYNHRCVLFVIVSHYLLRLVGYL